MQSSLQTIDAGSHVECKWNINRLQKKKQFVFVHYSVYRYVYGSWSASVCFGGLELRSINYVKYFDSCSKKKNIKKRLILGL